MANPFEKLESYTKLKWLYKLSPCHEAWSQLTFFQNYMEWKLKEFDMAILALSSSTYIIISCEMPSCYQSMNLQ